jgi:hypothetical protein
MSKNSEEFDKFLINPYIRSKFIHVLILIIIANLPFEVYENHKKRKYSDEEMVMCPALSF